jgi:RNA polymerase sigma-70 factor (ECF subfamily)
LQAARIATQESEKIGFLQMLRFPANEMGLGAKRVETRQSARKKKLGILPDSVSQTGSKVTLITSPVPARIDMNCETQPNEMGSTDGSLVQKLQSGEQQAATELYMRYADRLLRLTKYNTAGKLSSRFDPEDVVQSVFRTFFRRVAHGALEIPAGEELWRLLLVLSLNKIRGLGKFHSTKKRSVDRTLTGANYADIVEKLAVPDPQPRKILELVIEDVLSGMPLANRQIIEQRIEGASVVEIAAETKRSRRTVERVLKAFREKIAELIHDK